MDSDSTAEDGPTRATSGPDFDVAVVGGGPAGSSAAVFTARYGLETVVFDRGRSSLKRCAHLENYLGFPAGIDIERFYDLMHDHVREAGCDVRPALVEAVERADECDGFVLTLQEGGTVTARRVVAATRYDGEYLFSLDDEMVTTQEHGGETHEVFDDEYPAADGSTPIEGLYVATPSGADRQAIIAAGRGARTGVTVVEEYRRDRGLPEGVADHYDWLRRRAELDDKWEDRDNWREWFDERVADEHDTASDAYGSCREAEIDRRLATYLDDDEIERRRQRCQDRLLDHLDDDRILERAREIEAQRSGAETND